jgi:O-antigen/teichoic acid export membrane protein
MSSERVEPAMTRLARGGALNLVGAVSAGLFGLALVIVVTHVYSQQVAGAFFAATSLFVILGAVSGLGSDAGLGRWLPRQLALGRPAAARRTVPIALVPVLATACAAALAVAVTAPWLADVIDAAHPGEATVMLRVLAVFLPVAALHDGLLAATRGHAAMRPTVLIEKMFRQGAQVTGAVVAPLVSGHPAMLALAWASPYLPGAIAAAVWYHRLAVRSVLRPAKHAETPPQALADQAEEPQGWGAVARFWSYTAPRAIAQIFQTALQRADILLIAALGSPKDAAIYTAATRFMVVGQLSTQAIQQVMQPAVSRLLALSDTTTAGRVFAVSTTWTVALTWPVHLAVATAAPAYLGSFGPGYASPGQVATVILALTMLLATASGPVDVMLLMAGRSGLSLVNNAAALAVNLALNLLFIPPYGITGAAVAWSAAIVTRNLLPLVQVRRLLGMSPAGHGLLWACGAAVLSFAGVPLLVRAGLGTGLGAVATGLILGAAVYAVLVWTARGRLGLEAFASLLPGRRSTTPLAAPGDVPMRSAHVHGS